MENRGSTHSRQGSLQLQARPEPSLERRGIINAHNEPVDVTPPITPSEFPMPPSYPVAADPAPDTAADSSTKHENTVIDTSQTPAEADEQRALRETHLGKDVSKEVIDVGWNDPSPDDVPPLVKGLSNDDLWILLRRFNKHVYHVKAIDGQALPGGLDLNISDKEEFSPEKLRANIERLYTTVIIGMAAFVKHLARLRSWHERTRTIYFLAAYYFAWLLNLLMPAFFSLLIVLIVHPPSRHFLFPPAPLAAISSTHGGLQKPRAGQLATKDSLTGAPEKYKGEAVEQEASDFVSSVASLAVGTAVGKGRPGEEGGEEANSGDIGGKGVPDPTQVAMQAGQVKEVSAGKKPADDHSRTKEPVQDAVWDKARPAMRALADVSDAWEMFANALSPTPPFRQAKRLQLAGIVVPLLLASLVLNEVVLYKSTTFFIGFAFFGQPVIDRGAHWLNHKVPNWQFYIQPRNTLLKGVPTNAQLTLTLLRIGEANKCPLPPPPQQRIDEPAPTRPSSPVSAEDLPHEDVSQAEVDAIQYPDHDDHHRNESNEQQKGEGGGKGGGGNKIVKLLKGTAKAGVTTVLGADRVKAKIGSENAKRRLGVLPNEKEEQVPVGKGPTAFKARYAGRKGYAVITTSATSPCISFSTEDPTAEEEDKEGKKKKKAPAKPIWSVALGGIQGLKKIGGLGVKGRLLVGYALGMQIVDGLEIVDEAGKSYVLTAVEKREELFNRLIAIEDQKWECY